MSADYVSAEVPERYWVTLTTYCCRSCQQEFSERTCPPGDLVKFVEETGSEERWLPTYEKGGYLDLLERLVPGYSRSDEIRHAVSSRFLEEFRSVQELAENGKCFVFDERQLACPSCGSRELTIVKEEPLTNPPVKWMRYRP